MHRKQRNQSNSRLCYLLAGGVLALGAAFYPLSAKATETYDWGGSCPIPYQWNEAACPLVLDEAFESSSALIPWAWEDSIYDWQPEWTEELHSGFEPDPIPPLLHRDASEREQSDQTNDTIDG